MGKLKTNGKDTLSITPQIPRYVGYLDCALRTPVGVQIKNSGKENAQVQVCLGGGEGALLPLESEAEAPFESCVFVQFEECFSPLALSENDELKKVTVRTQVSLLGKEACLEETELTLLPYDWWEGLSGNPERLACFVRPRLSDCAKVLQEAGTRLKKWNAGAEFSGYTGANKNTVRQVTAAIFAAIKSYAIELDGENTIEQPCRATQERILKNGKASALELACFALSCLEAAGLHPVLAIGKRGMGVGVWLYDSCFLDAVSDDSEIVEKYISEGVNNLSFFDIDDLFSEKNIAFTPSEGHFAQKLKAGYYEYFVDIRRCRVGKILPLPLRGKGVRGYELYGDSDLSPDEAPAPLPELKKLSLEGKQPKNKQWERRLLDLTAKNTLLNFHGRNALHLSCADADTLYQLLGEKGSMKLKTGEPTEEFSESTAAQKELTLLEQKKGVLRAFIPEKTVAETALKLFRRNKESVEETGAKILYLAFGFLQYVDKVDSQIKYAPLVLAPVAMKRAKGNEDFSLELSEKEYFVNTTLLEYLKQEFNVDVRGLGGDVSALKISEIFAMILAEISSMKGWTVKKDAYLSTFSFQRYLMWNDIRNHFEELGKNQTVNALLHNRASETTVASVKEEDEGDPSQTLIPLPADSSQYSAVALSRTGASFVLHGPPGTGKSQTITNIIANALKDNKRVLFVAEKKAALDVVKKRLDGLGIGDFCLELHSNKTDKADVLKRMENTLQLAGSGGESSLSRCSQEIVTLREELKSPMLALHKKRRLGVSVYQAILFYLQNENAPDILDIESSFYDSLTEEKLAECKRKILSAAAAANECGGVSRSPFENVNVSEYSVTLRDRLFCSCEVVLAEIKHLKAYLALFLEFYRQKTSTVTQAKLDGIALLAKNLLSGVYDKYFKAIAENKFYTFYNCNRRFDELLSYYYLHFKTLVDFGKDRAEIERALESGERKTRNSALASAAKKLNRAALHPLTEEDTVKYLQTTVEIYQTIDRIRENLPPEANFFDRSGDINFKKRKEYLNDLYLLHETCQKTFLDYNADAFNGMCIRAQNGYTAPVLEGYLKAVESFRIAKESFLSIICADRNKIAQEDVLEYFSVKASALIDHIDMLANWCMYQKTGEELKALGCHFITEALESGRLSVENVLSGFEKNVYKNFLEINIPLDPDLSRMSVGTIEDTAEKFRAAWEECSSLSREEIKNHLISRLPSPEEEGSLSVELSAFKRLSKGNLRGMGLRGLFAEIPELIKRVCPCMLMSPVTVAQYLQPQADIFDLVIFDEASQMSTAEAIGSIARAKAAVIVGDPKQLPPTSFFRSAYVDEENLENEDLESVLDDCLALGMPERHLTWHYRSKHESLIAFSNSMYYDDRLCTFPSPDSLESKVKLVNTEGVYDRGFTKRNRKETEALVAEVIRRLKDPVLSRSSMGIVTFSGAQQNDIEKLLAKEIAKNKLESAAYDVEEQIFVKNLENVQGDERDVILFSVCYGPDSAGRISLNFGPLNQAGGWRRLNVAVSRAREEMIVFSSMTASMIDLSKTSSKGVAGLKAFLEFAEKGRTNLAGNAKALAAREGIGKHIASALSGYGYECRQNVGSSEFKIDVAVLDPSDNQRFILAILTDSDERFSVKDRNALQIPMLKRGNWNVIRINSVNYYNNPKRELKRVKDLLDKLTGEEKKGNAWIEKNSKPYRAVKQTGGEVAAFITSGVNDGEILARLREIVNTEEPISRSFLKARLLATFGICKTGVRVESCLDGLIDQSKFRRERICGKDYFYLNDRAISTKKFRIEAETPLRKTEEDFTPFEVVAFIRSVLEERVSIYFDELLSLFSATFRLPRAGEKFASFLRDCIAYGEQKGVLVRSVSDRITLA